jgi:Skp family chaperone for outer membrane proteins
MKTMLRKMLVMMLLGSALALPALGQPRIGTIDLRNVFDHYWKRNQAQAALKEHQAAIEKELKGFVDDYTRTKEEYTKLLAAAQDQSKSQQERDKAKSAAEAKLLEIKTSENTIRTYNENAKDALESQNKRMREGILQDIQAAVNAKAKASGYTMVIDTTADSMNLTPVILYSNGENDMTEAILAQLNAGAPPPTDTPKDADKPAANKDGKK